MYAIQTLQPSRLSRKQKERRLRLIKERYRKLVLEPRMRIQLEMAHELGDDTEPHYQYSSPF